MSLHAPRPRSRLLVLLVILAALGVVAVGCTASGDGDGAELLRYERVHPDGFREDQTISANGQVVMRHGEFIERFVISEQDVQALRDALARPIPTGSPDDSPKRTLSLPDGTVIQAPRPDPGTVTELLDRLIDAHGLG